MVIHRSLHSHVHHTNDVTGAIDCASQPRTDKLCITLRNPPSSRFLFGTNQLGQDILSRIMYGSTTMLEVGILSVIICMADRRADRARGRIRVGDS